jgi:hypothetical protein
MTNFYYCVVREDFSSSSLTCSGEIVIKQLKIFSIASRNTMGRVFSPESQEEAEVPSM